MSEVFDAELLLLRNRFSKTLGYFSPCFNSILLPAHTVEAANGKTLKTIVHEKAHWTQFNASPWGQFLLLLYEWYVWLSEEILVHTRQASRRVDKPLSFFLQFRRENDDRLNALCNQHITALNALPLMFRGGAAIDTQDISDAINGLGRAARPHSGPLDTLLSNNSPLRPPAHFDRNGSPSWPSLLETWARSLELLVSVRHHLDSSDATAMPIDQVMSGDYGSLLLEFLELAGLDDWRVNERQTYSMLAVCAVALQSPMHPGFGADMGRYDDWSDVLPELRFAKAARAIRETGPVGELRPSDQVQHESAVADLIRRICDHLDWPTPGDLTKVFVRRCEQKAITPGTFAANYLAAAPFIQRDPSLLAFGPCHSMWNSLEAEIGDIPVFVDPLLSKRLPGPAGNADLDRSAYNQIMIGVRFNLYNEVLFEDSFNRVALDTFSDAQWVEDAEARAVADRFFISPVFDGLQERGILVKDIFQWDVYSTRSKDKRTILVKSAMPHADYDAVFQRGSQRWQAAVNGRQMK